jgi:NADH:ubiquinone oxidoreductase subunit 3 (subunit A)
MCQTDLGQISGYLSDTMQYIILDNIIVLLFNWTSSTIFSSLRNTRLNKIRIVWDCKLLNTI